MSEYFSGLQVSIQPPKTEKPITPAEAEEAKLRWEKEKQTWSQNHVISRINNALSAGTRTIVLHGHHMDMAGCHMKDEPELIQYVIQSYSEHWNVYFEAEILKEFAGYYKDVPKYTFIFTPK